MTDYRYIGNHPGDLADGKPLVPGETVRLDKAMADDPHNRRLIDEGLLLPVPDKKPKKEEE